MINIGLLGLGTVGTGIVEIVNERNDLGIKIKAILVRDKNKKRDVDLSQIALTKDFKDILNDKDIDVIVEVTGDMESSYKYIIDGLNNGKHIVTANKAVVSKYFEEISDLADKKGLAFLYEASVGGGIPVIKPLREQLMLNDINDIQGILNGTCNYILTRMFGEDKDYGEVLKTAQELGYAEADPTADVEGHDTLRKLRILSTLGLKSTIKEEDILLYGISSISSVDIENIKKMNSTVKLIAEAKRVENGFTAIVQPTIVNNNNYFANVNMAYNSIAFKGDNVGDLKFYGPGAGKLPTANAVLSDVLDILNNTYRKGNPLGKDALQNENKNIKGKYYLRVSDVAEDSIGKLNKISIEVIQNDKDMAILTRETRLVEVVKLVEELGLKKDEYFLAKIMQ